MDSRTNWNCSQPTKTLGDGMAELKSNEILSKIKPSNLLLHHPASNNLSNSIVNTSQAIKVILVSRYQGHNGKWKYSGSSNLYWPLGELSSIDSYFYKVTGHSGANITYSSEPTIDRDSNFIYVAFTGPETDAVANDIEITVQVTFSYVLYKSTFSGRIIYGDYSKYCCYNIYLYNSQYGVFNCESLTINPLSDSSEWVLYDEKKNYFVTLNVDWKNHIWSILFDDQFKGSNTTVSKNCLFQSNETEFYLELVSYYTI